MAAPVMHQPGSGARVQCGDLPGELVGRPEIVVVEEGHPRRRSAFHPCVARRCHAARTLVADDGQLDP